MEITNIVKIIYSHINIKSKIQAEDYDMKKENKKIIKDILQGNGLEINIPAYASAYISATYTYTMIHLILNYYTIKEIQEDTNGITNDEYLSASVDKIHTILFETILADSMPENYKDIIAQIHELRSEMTEKMTILTAYTDALQIYEYILNRIEYMVTGEEYPIEESELAAKVFQYLFNDNDKMVVNSKIQMVTGQLPIRMTKNRFYDYLTDTLNIYNGSDKSSVDDFITMLKSTALLELPNSFEDAYPPIAGLIKKLQDTQFKSLQLEEYNEIMNEFSMVTSYLTELVSNYLLVMEIINDLYSTILALPYQKNDNDVIDVCISMLNGLHNAFISESDIPESVNDGFMKIEGFQEELGEDIMQYESILEEVMTEHKDTISWLMSDRIFDNLLLISKLMSNSLFIDLEKDESESETADLEYITSRRDELVSLLSDFFENHQKEVNRAIMAALFSNMPVLFNSQQEIKDYIEYSLNHCNNQSELMACAKILNDMIEED